MCKDEFVPEFLEGIFPELVPRKEGYVLKIAHIPFVDNFFYDYKMEDEMTDEVKNNKCPLCGCKPGISKDTEARAFIAAMHANITLTELKALAVQAEAKEKAIAGFGGGDVKNYYGSEDYIRLGQMILERIKLFEQFMGELEKGLRQL